VYSRAVMSLFMKCSNRNIKVNLFLTPADVFSMSQYRIFATENKPKVSCLQS